VANDSADVKSSESMVIPGLRPVTRKARLPTGNSQQYADRHYQAIGADQQNAAIVDWVGRRHV